MALIKFGQIIAEARGSVAGTVFSRNTAGSYMRQKVSPVQPRTVPQLLVRALLTAVSQAWRDLTEAQRLVWITVAVNFSHTNIFGDNVPLTGFGLFSQLNRNRQEIGQTLLTDAPSQAAVQGFTAFSAVIDNAEIVEADKIKLTFSSAVPADQKVIVYATAPLSAGINFVKAEYRKLTFIDDADVSPFSAGDVYNTVFGGIPAAGSKAFFKFRPLLTASGLSGTDITASDIAV